MIGVKHCFLKKLGVAYCWIECHIFFNTHFFNTEYNTQFNTGYSSYYLYFQILEHSAYDDVQSAEDGLLLLLDDFLSMHTDL